MVPLIDLLYQYFSIGMNDMSFKKNKYAVIRKVISEDLAIFIANYFRMQKQVHDTCKHTRYFSPFENILGEYEDKKTGQKKSKAK